MIELAPWPLSYEAMNTLYANTDQSRCLVQLPVPLERANTFRYLQAVQSELVDGRPFLVRAILYDERIIGKIELTLYESDDSELDIVIRKEYTHKGYGKQALALMEQTVREMRWCRSVYAYVDTENIPAGRLLASSGYEINRFFTADVMIPADGSYILKTKRGCEMRKMF